jgi:CHAT domain-containing protein
MLALRLRLACWAWVAIAAPGLGMTVGADGMATCVERFAVRPDDPESAHCFWLAGNAGGRKEAGRWVRKLLALHPGNPGLDLYSTLLEPGEPERDEARIRSVASRFAHRNAVGEVLARDTLVDWLLFHERLDEAALEVAREDQAARAIEPQSRDRYLAYVKISQARLLMIRGDLEQAVLRLDEIPDGPLRDRRWLLMASEVHKETGQLERSWNECLLLAQPGQAPYYRAAGWYCQAQILLERAAELPDESYAPRLRHAARAAIAAAGPGGNRIVTILARWVLIMAAETAAEAQQQFRLCLAAAPRDAERRLCGRGLARWEIAKERPLAGDLQTVVAGGGDDASVSQVQAYRDRMRMSWVALPCTEFVRTAQDALAKIEWLRAQQGHADSKMGLFSTWSNDYYWFSGRLLEAPSDRGCPSRLELAFGALERLRARALVDIVTGAGAARPAVQADAARLPALRQAIERVGQRRLNESFSPGEREESARDLEILMPEEQALRSDIENGRALASSGPPALGAPTAQPPDFATLSDVQRLLAPNEAMLSFQIAPWRAWTGEFAGGAWLVVVTRSARRWYRLEQMGRSDLRKGVADLFEHRFRSRFWQASELYRQLLGRALAELPPSIDSLIMVPDDHLHRLPFAALRATAAGRPMVWRYQISIVPSATLWARWRAAPEPRRASRPALVLADPRPPSAADRRAFQASGITLPVGQLPASRMEADALTRYLGWGCERLVGSGVSVAALAEPRHSLRDYALVHFAAHSIVDELDPRRSGIWLSPSPRHDGLFRFADIMKLTLDGRLIVLSTCSSNGGPFLRGEGVLSLAHAFFQAGARTVVASLWPQLDTDEEALFTAFYRHLGEGASVAAALRLAQLDRLRQDPNLPPLAWAGMVVLGDGELVPFPGGRHPWPPRWFLAAAAAVAALLAALVFCVFRTRLSRSSPGKGRAILGSAR